VILCVFSNVYRVMLLYLGGVPALDCAKRCICCAKHLRGLIWLGHQARMYRKQGSCETV